MWDRVGNAAHDADHAPCRFGAEWHDELSDLPNWRAMEPGDLSAVMNIAAVVHPALPEKIEVFAERLALFPRGCHVLDGDDGVEGYVVAHPWRALSIPPLDSLIGQLP